VEVELAIKVVVGMELLILAEVAEAITLVAVQEL
jgi:hypothetical protein